MKKRRKDQRKKINKKEVGPSGVGRAFARYRRAAAAAGGSSTPRSVGPRFAGSSGSAVIRFCCRVRPVSGPAKRVQPRSRTGERTRTHPRPRSDKPRVYALLLSSGSEMQADGRARARPGEPGARLLATGVGNKHFDGGSQRGEK